ncbi:MAG: peptidoglycan-associated lipoprotein Pal [Candidatus Eisenbacteria bacterium]
MTKRVLSLGIVLGLALVLATVGCSKKPPAGEILPPPGTTVAEPGTGTTDRPVTPTTDTQAAELALEDVFFEYDKYHLTPAARELLAADAQILLQNRGARVLIEGHCDERGTREYNLALGDRRANAARDFLVTYGIEAGRIETISYGKERPFAFGTNESAWSQNRRAHFVVQE